MASHKPPTPIDALEHVSLAKAVRNILDQSEKPTNILLYGGWGVGKSTFLEYLAEELGTI